MKNKVENISIVVTEMSGFGGTEKMINTVIDHYSKDNGKTLNLVSFYSVKGQKWCNADIEVVDILSDRKKNNYVLALSLFMFFLKSDADKVIVTNQFALPVISYARKFNHKKFEIISWVHFDLVEGPMSSESKISAITNYADKFISLSDSNSELLLSKGFSSDNLYTVYNPVTITQSMIPSSSKGTYQFIYVGRLQFSEKSQKNNKEFFDALIRIKKLDWFLNIYGDGEDLESEKLYISQNGLDHKVKFHGWVNKPFNEIKEADCLVMSSTYEGFPLTVVEAMSYGIPVVSSNINGPNEIINDKNGVLYDKGNNKQLSLILKNLIRGKISFDHRIIQETCYRFSEESFFEKFDRIFD
ncbi:glycosyltransferase [Lactococcus lactis]|uniref:glycosyltransferase n=1 Tax=Lactococcus lactis TaxID=1358 RepID=UPI00288FE4EC|nr:glycosyltransferase [Lactococcus lactis]MDT2886052.1 glycosyltransferase [Lactococcus lactis]